MLITPSILVYKKEDFVSQITRLAPYYNHFQIDITDGILFTGQKTISLEDVIDALTTNYELRTMNLVFDFHLMVRDYDSEIKKLEKLKDFVTIDTVLIHFSALSNYSLLTTNYPLYKFGIVLNPDEKVEDLAQKFELSKVQGVQIMTVSPGAQGQEFIPEALNKIEQLRDAHYRNIIFLDGAINDKTLPVILQQKSLPDVIGPGSYFSKATNVEEQVKKLQNLLQGV